MIKELGDATIYETWQSLCKKHGEVREDPVSGSFNSLCHDGKIVPTGKTRRNTTGFKAITWRKSTREEFYFLRAYVGKHKTPWPSGDTILKEILTDDILIDVIIEELPKLKNMIKEYRKAVLFRTKLKDKGITWFMEKYGTDGMRVKSKGRR